MFVHFYLVYVRHFLNHAVVFLVVFSPLPPLAQRLGSRLFHAMVAPVPNGSAGTDLCGSHVTPTRNVLCLNINFLKSHLCFSVIFFA